MALRSMSPRITGALIGFAVLSACGSNPPALTSPSQPTSGFATKYISPFVAPANTQIAFPTNLQSFSYFGFGLGSAALGCGTNILGASILGAPLGIFPPAVIPYNLGAIGSALPVFGPGTMSPIATEVVAPAPAPTTQVTAPEPAQTQAQSLEAQPSLNQGNSQPLANQ